MNPIGSLRRELGISQKTIAETLGVAQSTVSQWESGKNIPDLPTARKLAILYGVSIEELLEDAGDYPTLKPESELRHNFLCLTEEARVKVLEYSRDMMKIPQYCKRNEE